MRRPRDKKAFAFEAFAFGCASAAFATAKQTFDLLVPHTRKARIPSGPSPFRRNPATTLSARAPTLVWRLVLDLAGADEPETTSHEDHVETVCTPILIWVVV